MATRQKKNSRLSGLAIPTICLCILSYFGFHAFQGSLGVHSRTLMDRQYLELQFKLARIKLERQEWDLKVKLLRNGSIEKDMLDEQARHMLNVVMANELVIFRD